MIMKLASYIRFLLFLLPLAGCGTGPATAPATPANNAAASPLSDEECIAFSRELEKHIEAGDADSATAMIDWEGLFDEAVAGLSSDEEPNEVVEGLRVGNLRNPSATYAAVIDDTKAGGSYKFLRVKSSPEGKRVLFRFRGGNNRGLNYHEISLVRKGNQCIGRDILVYTTGDNYTKLIRRRAILGIAGGHQKKSLPLSDFEKDCQTYSDHCAALTKAVNTGHYADGLEAYNRLPPSLQRERCFLLLRLEAAERVSKEETIAALDAFRKAYPNDATLDLHLIHSQTLKGEFAAAREAIDDLDKSVGGDPCLDVMRAQFFLKEKNLADADTAAQKAIAGDRTLKEAWWVRVTVALKTRDYSRAVELLKTLETEHRQEPADTTGPLYAEFVESPEYKKWQAEKPSTP